MFHSCLQLGVFQGEALHSANSSELGLKAGDMAPNLCSRVSDRLKVRGNGTCLPYLAAKIKINPSDFYETTSESLAFQRTLWGKDVKWSTQSVSFKGLQPGTDNRDQSMTNPKWLSDEGSPGSFILKSQLQS